MCDATNSEAVSGVEKKEKEDLQNLLLFFF